MRERDFYNVLGVSREATPDELKKAYRALAMRFHPDRNPGDAVAEQRFKHISEAYRVLSDPEERARYDRLGPLYTPDGRPPRPDEVSDVIGRMWDNLFGRRARAQGEDLKYAVSVTLEEVATGVTRELVVPRQIRCVDCRGLGAQADGRELCPICSGSGKSTGARLFRSSCYHCGGKGYVIHQPCGTCAGEGRHGHEDRLKVKVPAGVATGQKLKLSGKGNEPAAAGSAGDLLVVVSVADHPLFRRRGADLVVELPLGLHEATNGADVSVPTIDGTTTIRIPPGTTHGRIFRLSGRGLPGIDGARQGDLHLEVVIEVPTDLDDSERTRLAAWATTLPPTRHPKRQLFDRAVEERR